MRKRARADVEAAHKFAVERIAESLLPVMDSLEAALARPKDAAGAADRDHPRSSSSRRFEKASLSRRSARRPASASTRTSTRPWQRSNPPPSRIPIVAVMQKGYRLHDRVLRPALVTVAKALENKGGNPISDSNLNTN